MPFCIYSNSEVSTTEGSFDHIVPLSLGGSDFFGTFASRQLNSQFGSHIEGALLKDPLVSLAVGSRGYCGHSGKPHVPVWKKVELDGKPVQVSFGQGEVKFWDCRKRREISSPELSGKEFRSELKMDLHATTRYLAKVALGTGFNLYGIPFSEFSCLDVVRKIFFIDPIRDKNDALFLESGVRIMDRFHSDSLQNGSGYVYRVVLEALDCSAVISIPHDDGLSVHTSIGGSYIGGLFLPGNTHDFPLEGEHALGRVVLLGRKSVVQKSFEVFLREFYARNFPSMSELPDRLA